MFNSPPTASWVMKRLCHIKDALKEWNFQDTYSIKLFYVETFKACTKVRWRFVVQNKMSIPRHRFCVWVFALEKLKTKDKHYTIGVRNDALCPLYATNVETVRYLFFDCPFSRKCLDGLESWVGVGCKNIASMDLPKLRFTKSQPIRCTIYACAISNIWRSRNTASWDLWVPHPHHIVSLIKAQTDARLTALGHSSTLANLILT